MKLVDILARELKEWPEQFGGYAISARAEGTYAVWFNHRKPTRINDGWSDIGCVELWLEEKPADQHSSIVTRAQWQAAVDALKAGEQGWDGEGLPPVGTVCEYNWRGEWRRVTVAARVQGLSDRQEVILQLDGDWTYDHRPSLFRTVRTAEQIAADDQSAQINRMINESLDGVAGVTISQARTICSQLHKAGYRKQVQP